MEGPRADLAAERFHFPKIPHEHQPTAHPDGRTRDPNGQCVRCRVQRGVARSISSSSRHPLAVLDCLGADGRVTGSHSNPFWLFGIFFSCATRRQVLMLSTGLCGKGEEPWTVPLIGAAHVGEC